jgi:glycosyltransferase involved in cell wall biosynthesis
VQKQTLSPSSSPSESGEPGNGSSVPILVHSHLRWDFVWQRPQQVLGRLARHHPVAFVEEPLHDDGEPRLAVSEPHPNVVRIVPMLPLALRDDADAQYAATARLLRRAFASHPRLAGRFEAPIQWFYTPMVAPAMLAAFPSAVVVYDCMDELANFRGAPAELSAREAELLAAADVVFTGGHRLYVRKSQHHGNVHFYGCGVDAAHYAKARAADTEVPADVASLPHPILGYFGVIDERLDYELIDALSAAFPDGSVVMVGPVVKVDPGMLPHRPNIHWLGQRAYQDLPAYAKGFDVCLMPFALNAATENINPTKTLEYMAAGKPVVSTAVPDVLHHFTPIVAVAGTRTEYVELAARAATTADPDTLARGIERAEGATWDAIVDAMRDHILSAIEARRAVASAPLPAEQETVS